MTLQLLVMNVNHCKSKYQIAGGEKRLSKMLELQCLVECQLDPIKKEEEEKTSSQKPTDAPSSSSNTPNKIPTRIN